MSMLSVFTCRPSETINISTNHSCDIIRYVTSIYLAQMILMTLTMASTIIGCFLAFITSSCHKCIVHVSVLTCTSKCCNSV